MPVASKLKVGVVDDQSTIRSLVRSSLNQIGINDVRMFPDAAEALQKLRAEPVQILISDFNMPGMDGLELLRAVRADATFAKTAFILLTGRTDKELVQQAAQLGVNNYLAKPFSPAQLKQKIEQVVGALT